MLTVVVIIIIVGMLIYLGVVIGDARARNQFYKEKKELLKEKKWWEDKSNDALEDLKKTKSALKDAIVRNDDLWKQNSALIEENDSLTNKLSLHLLSMNTIEMKNQEEIIELYKQGLTQAEIAKRIGCAASTISRAIKKWGLTR